MMEISKIKELVALMADNDLTEVELKGEKESVMIKRGGAGSAPVIQYSPAPVAPVAAPAPAAPAAAAVASVAAIHVESPMVGTFYSSPNPDAAPFVKVGQQVTPDTVVCIIEAMKVFNEIKAEKSGTVESVLVKSGQSVEFGQKLFALKA
jgi:acetyl-CoA carboxylase biotin carboxyl carrier protein